LLREKKYFSDSSTSGLQQLNNRDNSLCSTAAWQHAAGKTCDPRAKSIIICFGVFLQ
jgi:hypothetical protein